MLLWKRYSLILKLPAAEQGVRTMQRTDHNNDCPNDQMPDWDWFQDCLRREEGMADMAEPTLSYTFPVPERLPHEWPFLD